jgi:hypothetical protein
MPGFSGEAEPILETMLLSDVDAHLLVGLAKSNEELIETGASGVHKILSTTEHALRLAGVVLARINGIGEGVSKEGVKKAEIQVTQEDAQIIKRARRFGNIAFV